jgi:DNA-directed RNA polymerase subunit H (RpoH/RPB5)
MERAHNICLEMLKQRNYEIIGVEDDKIFALKPDQQQMIVFFSDTLKFNIKNVKVYIALMDELEIFHGIIVYKEGITSFTKKAIEQTADIKLELFAEEDLQYNITKHRFQPKFEKLSVEETESMKTHYDALKFPIMRKTDPICRFYNYERGDIIKITRSSGFVAYRIVKS